MAKVDWFSDWEITRLGEGGVIIKLPNSNQNGKIVRFRSVSDARVNWVIDALDCALNELSTIKSKETHG